MKVKKIHQIATHINTASPFLHNEKNEITTTNTEQPLTLCSALKLAAKLEAKRVALTLLVKQLEEMAQYNAEKPELYDDITNAEESYDLTDAATLRGLLLNFDNLNPQLNGAHT
ncbi:hypothetical protein [Pseudomonas sp. Pseu.R1]|uniref:hypothetical protein n=1 Tax=Pseudomonas sp. Pseu.R1 TaxID=3379818 RepID=UPI003B925997